MEKAQKLLIDSLEKLIPTKPKITVSKHRLYFEPNHESALKVAEELLHHWRKAAFIITSNKIISGEGETSGRAMVIIPPESANRLAALLLKRLGGEADFSKDSLAMSALTETLNIIANSFVASIANYYHKQVWIGTPDLVDSVTFDTIITMVAERKKEVHVIFENNLNIDNWDIIMYLFIFLSPDIFNKTIKQENRLKK